ncbi:acylphosphatase [Chitinophaga defluvii]|uniref:acylphosphatase n=1 Tax=Chitinophaga defluvii TaxID=3163343 RepID=A0ABV2T1I8_9BACT
MEKIRKEITVKGRVQGVGFRMSTLLEANRLHIKGEVKNLPNGDVWIGAEGAVSDMEQFIAWCRHGPSTARVTEILIVTGPLQYYEFFNIGR